MKAAGRVKDVLVSSFLLLITGLCLAESKSLPVIDLILPVDNAPLRQFASHVQNQNRDYTVRQFVRTLPDPAERGDVLVTVSNDLLTVIDDADYPLEVALYVSEAEFADRHSDTVTGVFSDQPMRRQLALASAILDQRPARIAVPYLKPRYRHSFAAIIDDYPHLSAVIEAVSPDHPTEVINRLIQRSDVLLATPETDIYNADTIRSILLSSYRHRSMVIGPNQGFVTAGALASVVSEPIHYASQLQKVLRQARENGALPAADYPSDFTVAINHSVARSLGLPPLDAEQLKQRIQQALTESAP